VEESARKGWDLLVDGGSAINAVNVAVNSMEDDPIFDAGIGSVLTEESTVEMDALIMNGDSLDAGAVAGLRNVRYSVNLARVVMEETPHVLMIGEGQTAHAHYPTSWSCSPFSLPLIHYWLAC
jgi:beta-aspartyl-peptidase (threonine type)